MTLILSLLLIGTGHATQKIQLFELQHRLPEELMPALRPLLGNDVVMSRIGNKLVVKAERLKLAEIGEAIERLDQPARRLMIEFREVALDVATDQAIGLRGRLSIDDGTEIGAGGAHRDRPRLGARQARTRGRDDITQRVQTLEGRPAYLATGESIPITQTATFTDGRRRYRELSTEYRDATIGFHVRPQVLGDDRVVIDVSRHAQRLGPDGRVFRLQDTGTRIQGPLGQWLEVGGVQQQGQLSERGIAYSVQTTGDRDRRYQIRVTELD
jgi:type II secretory pathway component GspD/PulD (secretin)